MTGTTNPAFAEKIGKSAESVRRYRAGEREPDQKVMRLIFEVTGELVTPNDWVGVGPRPVPEPAADEVSAS
ncbi:helix-turn-helix domain-containing protein [Bradyrhizobium sp. HKCCYLRH2060]|uniref:helix-turn-helix domain-containing protein n=1 Tax=Bradyrhizobium sp. HKCCYLRH2060 TaxID=3420743 RepID=UPI003EBA0FFB